MTTHNIPLTEDRPHEVNQAGACWCRPKVEKVAGNAEVSHQDESG